MGTNRVLAATAGFVLVGALAIGCGSGSSSDESAEPAVAGSRSEAGSKTGQDSTVMGSSSSGDDVASLAPGQSDATGASGESAGTDTEALQVAPTEVGRAVVSTATMNVEADNVIEAKQRATTIVEAKGGVVFDEETELGKFARSTLTLRVPPDQFRAALNDLAGIGSLTSQDITTDDVTAQVVDLEARISSAEVSVDRMRGFLAASTSISEITQLESELTARESTLESLRGQQRTLAGRVDLATIVLTVSPVPVSTVAEETVQEADSLPGFMDGLSDGWGTFLNIGTVVLAALGWLLPFLPLVIGAVLVIRWLVKSRPARAATGSHLPPPPPQQQAPQAPVGAGV